MTVEQLREAVNNPDLDPTMEVWVGVFVSQSYDPIGVSIFDTAVSASVESDKTKFPDDKPRFLIWD